MNSEEANPSWFNRLKHFLHLEPQNKEELIGLLRDAHVRQLIDNETLGMIEGVILFSQMRVRDIMLPKKQMVCLSIHDDLKEIIQTVTESGHSRFPVIGDDKDDIIGVLHAKDLLRYAHAEDSSVDLHDLIRQASIIPESKRLDLLLSEFRTNRNHMAVVVDEYGLVSGFVTIEDIIEQIIGDIEDEFDIDEEAYLKAHGNGQYTIKALMPIDDFNDALNAQFSDENYDTIGGIVMAGFGHMPKRGDTLMIEQFEFKILNADSRRIKLLACTDKRGMDPKPIEPRDPNA